MSVDEGSVLAKVVWRPLPGSQTAFLASPFREKMLEGTRGGGKTDAVIMDFRKNVGVGFGRNWRGIIFRREYKHLDEIVKKCKEIFDLFENKPKFLASQGQYMFVFPTGETLALRGLKDEDDFESFKGHEYSWMCFDELTTWPTGELYEKMISSARSSVPGVPVTICCTTNPLGPGHGWVKRYWIDPAPPRLRNGVAIRGKRWIRARFTSYIWENPYLTENDPEYVAYLESIENPSLRAAWYLGDWNVAVGSFWEGVYKPEIHLVPPFDPPITWPRFRAMDWGFRTPYSIGWYALNPDGDLYRYRELYGWGGKENVGSRENAADVAKNVKLLELQERQAGCRFLACPADVSIWSQVGTRKSIQSEMAKEGVHWVKSTENNANRKSGWNAIATRFQHRSLFITQDCEHWQRTFPLMMPAEKDPEDIEKKGYEDHSSDEMRYAVVAVTPERGPEDEDTSTPRPMAIKDILARRNISFPKNRV